MKDKKYTLYRIYMIIALVLLIAILITIFAARSAVKDDARKKQLLEEKLQLISKAAISYAEDNLESELETTTDKYNSYTCQTITVLDLVERNYLEADNKNCLDNDNSDMGCVTNPRNPKKSLDDLNIIVYLEDNEIKAVVDFRNELECATEFLANKLIDDGAMWQSELVDDGYRFAGSGDKVYCTYDEGAAIRKMSNGKCPTLYNVVVTFSGDEPFTQKYKDYCPSGPKYECTKVNGEVDPTFIAPNNFICFGTSDKERCKKDEGKYLYRIIGVFEDSDGNDHVKLIKYKSIGKYAWDSRTNTEVSWEDSDLYKGLNGSYYMTNTKYDYMQSEEWSNKITDWEWNLVKTWDNNDDVFGNLDYYLLSPKDVYLHEMNRKRPSTVISECWVNQKYTTNTTCDFTIGEWSSINAKIGLMYASDYALSWGANAKMLEKPLESTLSIIGWIHIENNDEENTFAEWTIARAGSTGYVSYAWIVSETSGLYTQDIINEFVVRPVFYLNSDVAYKSGTGAYEDPFIIEE